MKAVSAKTKKVAEYMFKHPKASAKAVAERFDMHITYVYKIKRGIVSGMVVDKMIEDNPPPQELEVVNSVPPDDGVIDKVNHPPHYKVGGIETIDFIEAKQLDYHLGNVVKYITRAEHKGNKLEDLKKAQWYLNRAIDNLTK